MTIQFKAHRIGHSMEKSLKKSTINFTVKLKMLNFVILKYYLTIYWHEFSYTVRGHVRNDMFGQNSLHLFNFYQEARPITFVVRKQERPGGNLPFLETAAASKGNNHTYKQRWNQKRHASSLPTTTHEPCFLLHFSLQCL